MSVLNDKLEKIIADSGIYFYKDEIENELKIEDKIVRITEAIQKMWDALPCDANIAIYGLGFDSIYLFESVDLTKKNVVCMIDNNPELRTFKGYSVIRNEDIPANKIDIIIVTSSLYADEIKSSVESVAPDCKIMNMWDELDATGDIHVYMSDILLLLSKEFSYNVLSLNAAILSYNTTRDFRYLLYSIGSYLELRDLNNALAFIDKYISSNYPDADKMLDLRNNLNNLLEEIKQKLASKQNAHTLVLIADCMRAKDVTPELTPFLCALGKKFIHCLNAYTHIGWTSPSILTIFKQKSYIDNNLYKNVMLTGTEPFFEHLSKNNIDFAYYWPYVGRALFKNIAEVVKYSPNGCAYIMWQYLCSSFENDKKALYFLHFSETHAPHFCASHVNVFNSRNNFYLDCVKYIDSQTEFLFDLLPSNTKLLFCSDHGLGTGDLKKKSPISYHNDRYHIPYVICDRRTHNGTDKRLVSHIDTLDILLNLVNDKPAFENINHRTLVETNEEFLYSKDSIEDYTKRFGKLKVFYAHKSFISVEDKYVISYDGEERYFLLPDDDANLIDDERYADRINWFRQNVNIEFPDWSDDNGRYDITRKYFDIDKKKVFK